MAAARGLAVDGHQVLPIRPALGDPGHEAGRKQLRVHAVHQRAQPVGAGNAPVEIQVATQEIQPGLAPIDDVLIIVARADARADHQEQNLLQRIHHPPRRPIVLDHRKVVQQQPQARLGRKALHR